MFTRCLFCHAPFEENGELAHMPRGRTLAFDPVRGRLWTICSGCHRWTLCPLEDRYEALHELERMVRDHARLLTRTANIQLHRAGRLTLVRVGSAELAEQAWWRYGRELRRRKASFESPQARVSAYTFGALAWMADLVGLADEDLSIDWEDTPVADVLRWRRFGWAAWHGRETCPFCQSTLVALRYDLSWWVYPLRGEDGRLGLGIPCQRCDPWTPEKVYELQGDVAENTLRRILAYQNIHGAGEGRIVEAAERIQAAGSAGAFAQAATEERQSLWKMRGSGSVALEIALNETAEQRLLQLEAHALEFLWRKEEELARIIDEELTPRGRLEVHLRKLPVRLRPRVAELLGSGG